MEILLYSKDLQSILKKIKNAKLLDKADDSSSVLMLDASTNDFKIVSSNSAFWSMFSIDASDFVESSKTMSKDLGIKQNGRVFIHGETFIELISSYPEESILHFQLRPSKGKTKGECLAVSYSSTKKRTGTSEFALSKVKYFNEEPFEEKRKKIKVSGERFIIAAQAVCFATNIQNIEEADRNLFGCRIEIFKEDITATTTNKKRICYHGKDYNDKSPDIVLDPISGILDPILSNLKKEEDVELNIGSKTIILTQKNQQYVIPNIANSKNYPNCRTIISKVQSKSMVVLAFVQKELMATLKPIVSTAGKAYGMKIDLDTEAGVICFSAQKMEENGMVKAFHEETLSLDASNINLKTGEHVKVSVVVNIEFFKDIFGRFKASEMVSVCFGNADTPLYFESQDGMLKYVLCLLDPIK